MFKEFSLWVVKSWWMPLTWRYYLMRVIVSVLLIWLLIPVVLRLGGSAPIASQAKHQGECQRHQLLPLQLTTNDCHSLAALRV